MLVLFRLISLLWIGASVYWIVAEPSNIEPKVSMVGSVFSLLSFFYPNYRGAEVFITLHNESTPESKYKFMLHIENKGDHDAEDLRIVFPPTFPFFSGDRELVPKTIRAGELRKIRTLLSLGTPRSFEFEWSWRSSLLRRRSRKEVIQCQ
jgi:hypothetical protein